ncbi:DUF6542 domain-containing protein [Mycolicibacterium parafortuitum]|uniref:DUF6542 domain-containing protein n=1 Tax=Mycolicibacterium parafortuitum TaxID=39692 RepID=UPI0009F39825|nr:DUF6542 domain-containing protein [Mycolicibacterium parafortuitum]ORB28144.1 hypothetical protein BST38_21585 [Mycolicibacterium parafortuitum]
MSGQRARSAVAADHRSVHPDIAGIPWWGAILSAVVASAIGFAFDAGSGSGQLTTAFSTLYVLGCLIAVLAVQQASLFTAVIQPPLVLFVTVPGAYLMMHGSQIEGIKDLLINCGYPLIERFPLMFFTAAAVLLIGLARWYFAKSAPAAPASGDESPRPRRGGGLAEKVSALVGGITKGAQKADAPPKRARRAPDRRRAGAAKAAASRSARDGRDPARRDAPRRRPRPAETEIIEPVVDDVAPRRRRPRTDDRPAGEPRRRARPSSSARESREPREPREPRQPRERRARSERDDRYERPRPERRRPSRYDDRPTRYGDHEPFDPYTADAGSHHPVSRVRYRGEESGERAEYRNRRRDPREADHWEYDI